jgi:ABC-type lipoprotein release transport system permease subunit
MARSPFKYILRSSSSRRLTAFMTLTGISLVVFVFAAVLMMANGVQRERHCLAQGGHERDHEHNRPPGRRNRDESA